MQQGPRRRTDCAAQHAGAKRQPLTGSAGLQPTLLLQQAHSYHTALTEMGPWFLELQQMLTVQLPAIDLLHGAKLNFRRPGSC